MKAFGKNSVSSVLKVVVNIAWYLQLIGIGLILVIVILAWCGVLTENIKIEPPAEFNTSGVLIETGVEASSIQKTERPAILSKVNRDSTIVFYGLRTSIFLMLSLYVTFLLKKILRSLSSGIPFTLENSKRIRYISYIIMLTPAVVLVLDLVSLYWFQPSDSIQNGKVIFLPGFDLITLFLGLVIFIIAEVFKVGYEIQEEQKLVI